MTSTIKIISRKQAALRQCQAAGFSLVELMVAVTLGLIILAAIAQIFATSRSTYTHEEGLARVQEGGRFSMEFLATDIRMAGYMGCNSDLAASSINNIASPATNAYQMLAGGIRGYRYTGNGTNRTRADWTPNLPDDFFDDDEALAGTDVIVIQHASTIDTNLTGNMVVTNANIQILSTASVSGQLQDHDILMISDCTSTDIFRATTVSSGSGTTTIAHSQSNNSSNNLSKAYDTRAQLMKLVSRAYYIGTGASGEPSLMRKELVNANAVPPIITQELVEGVQDMRILYGLDTDSSEDYIPNRYFRADSASITDWGRVVSLRIALLLRTTTKVEGKDTQPYDLTGLTVGPFNDNRRRHVFTSTIKLRNAGI